MDPWRATSAGTLLVAVEPEGVDAVREALESEGLPAAEVGEVRSGEGVYDADGSRIEPPEGDSSWPVYARLAAEE
jgi:hydrogenase maturation factor